MAAVVVPPVVSGQTTLEKIENFMNDTSYKEAIESSMNYNTRLCIERRLRLPFLDSQTGVAQSHSSLFMHKRQRMPGSLPGQIYTYPRQRWRKKRRQYLSMNARAFGRAVDHMMDDSDVHSISQAENPALLQDTDSKDSQLLLKDEVPKEWFYDEQDIMEMDAYDEPDPDSDLDYEESYSKRSKKRRPGRGRAVDSPGTPGRKKGSGRGRKKASLHNFEPTPGDPDKPFACELCGARYKTRPGLTYHYAHSHKEGASDENSREASVPGGAASPVPPAQAATSPAGAGPAPGSVAVGVVAGTPPPPLSAPLMVAGMVGGAHLAPPPGSPLGEAPGAAPGNVYQDSYVSFLNHPAGTPGRRSRQSNPPGQVTPPTLPPNLPATPGPPPVDDPPMPVLLPEKHYDLPMPPPQQQQPPQHPPQLTQHAQPPMQQMPLPPPQQQPPPQIMPPHLQPQPLPLQQHQQPQQMVPMPHHQIPLPMDQKPKAPPSPYCDFCLGDSNENKKTGTSEELVSCSDCGRSGHPSCLQFTANMNVSVKKYRWQCIECKCCSMCGTSDNDDQLLFCDDCDRGYHMYCLHPPLTTPPEGSWSCGLCIREFHK